MSKLKLWIGIQRHGAGWRASVSQGRSKPPIQRHFPQDTDPRVMQAWREDTKATKRLARKQRATQGTFEGDARRYLRAVTALTTYNTRKTDIHRWITIFGTRQRETITAADIRAQRDRWLKEKRPSGQPYAASTINHWLRALSNLWTVLDGKRAPNPVREVPEVEEPDALPRAIPFDLIERIIQATTDRTRPEKGKTGPTKSLSRVRLRVLAYTGLTYAQLRRLTPADVNLEARTMLVRRREKGKGAKPKLLPLLPQAVTAFQAFAALNAWGHFSGGSLRKVFVLAVGKVRKQLEKDGVTLPPIRPYDFRHSVAAVLYRATGDLRFVGDMLQHTKARTTERYALSAVSDVLSAQLAKVDPHAKLSSQARTPTP